MTVSHYFFKSKDKKRSPKHSAKAARSGVWGKLSFHGCSRMDDCPSSFTGEA